MQDKGRRHVVRFETEGEVMKVRLLEDAHKTAPAGTVGELAEVNGSFKFCPEGREQAYWIGRVKWEAITEEPKAEEPKADVNPPRRRR